MATQGNQYFSSNWRIITKVMYIYIMLRTQISLTTEERRVLDAEAARTGKSMSALIREAIERSYGPTRSSSDDLDLMRQSFGTWGEREFDGARLVERMRPGSRLQNEDIDRPR